jgi:hypothetical protein
MSNNNLATNDSDDFAPTPEEIRRHTTQWINDLISGKVKTKSANMSDGIRAILLANKAELLYLIHNTTIKYHIRSWLVDQGVPERSVRTAIDSALASGYCNPRYLKTWIDHTASFHS